nr:movement protein [Streptocarpus flower break virus]WJP00477.1 movement protein [Streptocarpus flower break virus]
MAIVLSKPKVSEFLNLTKAEEILPKFLTRLKTVAISTRDVVSVKGTTDLVDIDLLRDVPVNNWRYVGIVGIVASGEWLLPDNVSGGVAISFVDKRLVDSREAILGTYRAAAVEKRFQFKLIPNYFVSQEDALRRPWQVQVSLKGLKFEEGFSPLTLEFVSVVVCANSVVTKGLRERLNNVGDPNVEVSEVAVNEFIDSISASQSLSRARNKYVRGNGKVGNNSGGFSKYNRHQPERFAGKAMYNSKNVVRGGTSEPTAILHKRMGGSNSIDESLFSVAESDLSDSGCA